MKKSYRSTQQIMNFASKIISHDLMPVMRTGLKPVVIKLPFIIGTIEHIAIKVNQLKANNSKSIAVICKTPYQCRDIFSSLHKKIDVRLINNDDA